MNSFNGQKFGFYLDEGGGGEEQDRQPDSEDRQLIKQSKVKKWRWQNKRDLPHWSLGLSRMQPKSQQWNEKKGGRRETSTKENISLAKWAFLVWLNKSSILAFVLQKQPGPRQNSGEEHQEEGRQQCNSFAHTWKKWEKPVQHLRCWWVESH